MTYEEFLESKRAAVESRGITPTDLNPHLFPFQRDIVTWALQKGRAAVFCECGLGKTIVQLEWARHVSEHACGNVLILAPLSVAQQTVREGEKFGIAARYCRDQADVQPGITITNYDMLHHFDPSAFVGVVADESGILKSLDGKTRTRIIESFAATPYRLACTATPAPNDHMELGNHAEFLGIMSRNEMLAMYFVHDGGETAKWRLKGHAEGVFWSWVCSWAVMVGKPSDLGYSDDDYALPPLEIRNVTVAVAQEKAFDEGSLFPTIARTLVDQRKVRKESLGERARLCGEIATGLKDGCEGFGKEQWVIWCEYNAEQDALAEMLGDECVSIQGSTSRDDKIALLDLWLTGQKRILVSKASVVGYGMNFQNCHLEAFIGVSHSYEDFHQTVRRCWRFGQEHPVIVYLFASESDTAIIMNLERKQSEADRMAEKMNEFRPDIAGAHAGTTRTASVYRRDVAGGDGWNVHLGDNIDVLREIETGSIGYSIYSPPFAELYTYSNSERDMGNARNGEEFAEHLKYFIPEMYRVLKPGRLMSFHCMNIPALKSKDGYIGLKDFRGELIRAFCDAGFIYHSEVTIWKDPVTQMQRTKSIGLLHKQVKKDAAMSRMGLPDYLVTMRKPDENLEPITHTASELPVELWQQYASPVWMDIDQSDTLQFRAARDSADERHIAPLQLGVIRRAIHLWTNPNDLILDPFNGIGSSGAVAIQMGRRYVGIELKESYWRQAVKNLRAVEEESRQSDLMTNFESPMLIGASHEG